MRPNKTYSKMTVKAGEKLNWIYGYREYVTYHDNFIYFDMPIKSLHRKVNGVYLSGGPWLSYKRYRQEYGDDIVAYRAGWEYPAYKGQLFTYLGTGGLFTETELLQLYSDLQNKGAEAWAKLKPAQPVFSAAVSLAELREVPGSLKLNLKQILRNRGRRGWDWLEGNRRPKPTKKLQESFGGKSHANILGDSYLAYFFGWLPLVNDIKSFVEEYQKRKASFDQLVRDAGRPVKRRCKISSPPDQVTTTVVQHNNSGHNNDIHPGQVTQYYVDSMIAHAKTVITTTTTVETWAVGKFRYFLPPGPRDRAWEKMVKRRLFGLRITPSAIYNVLPWSWLADYFTDLGQFVDAVSAGVEDNLYAEYAYVMRTVKRNTKYVCTEAYWNGPWWTTNIASVTVEVDDIVKMRVPANIFGFGIREDELSLKQLGILASLGLSRL